MIREILMRHFFKTVLMFAACTALPAVADPGYIVTVRALEKPDGLVRWSGLNSAGWAVASVSDRSENRDILYGPRGYKRDLSSITASPRTFDGILPEFVAEDGTVYLKQGVYTVTQDKDSITRRWIKDRFFKLDLDAADKTEVFYPSFSALPQFDRPAAINEKKQTIVVYGDPWSPRKPVVLRKIGPEREVTHTFSFPPSRRTGGRSAVNVKLDNNGSFVAYTLREDAHRKTALSNLCVGSFDAEEVSCMAPRRIARLARRRYGISDLAAFVDGIIFLKGGNRHVRLDAKTFEITSSTKIRPGAEDETGFLAGGAIATVINPSFNDSRPLRLVVWDGTGAKRRYECDVLRDLQLEWFFSVTIVPRNGGGLLIGLEGQTGVLLELAPAELTEELTSAGQSVCKPVS
jgi:hypothetical protein